jgi:peptidyl-dipeptidase Dcp
MTNPLSGSWTTPYETPPFHLIEPKHFKPAIENAINSASEEIRSITDNPEEPTFENTIEALEKSGERLTRISATLFNLNAAETSPELQTAAQQVSPLLARFSNDVTLNERLFKRINEVYSRKDSSDLTTEQYRLLENKYRDFILGGAGLDNKKKASFREISEELSKLTLKFEENVLAENNSFELNLTDPEDLAGLPDGIIEAAAEEANKRKKDGWVFTLHHPSYFPFMQYSERRDLRKKMFMAYSSRGFHGDERDNRSLVSRIVNLRLQCANLLGFANYAEMILGDRMAESPSKVSSFLDEIYSASRNAAKRDLANLEDFAARNGHKGRIERWDWAYYSEKLKKSKFEINDELLKPYFSLEIVQKAVFGLASRLYGLKFMENISVPIYHKEVKAFEVLDEDNSLIAILYLDYHPRKGKNGGAWMTNFRDQRREEGKNIIPIVSLVTNFTRPTASKPSLLTFTELTTFLHEFGHALHSMLSRCTYGSLAGTNVPRDFVELPSQIMENWAFEREWLDLWAVHYETGEKITYELITKIKEASTFNEGYACNRQLGFGFLDMAWHTITEPVNVEIGEFEEKATERTEMFPKTDSANTSCAFTHIFGGGYAAGYYGYKWAEVLDADAFRYFKESGIFNRSVSDSFRKNILEMGGSDKALNLYVNFRGKEPSIDAFIERSGLMDKT